MSQSLFKKPLEVIRASLQAEKLPGPWTDKEDLKVAFVLISYIRAASRQRRAKRQAKAAVSTHSCKIARLKEKLDRVHPAILTEVLVNLTISANLKESWMYRCAKLLKGESWLPQKYSETPKCGVGSLGSVGHTGGNSWDWKNSYPVDRSPESVEIQQQLFLLYYPLMELQSPELSPGRRDVLYKLCAAPLSVLSGVDRAMIADGLFSLVVEGALPINEPEAAKFLELLQSKFEQKMESVQSEAERAIDPELIAFLTKELKLPTELAAHVICSLADVRVRLQGIQDVVGNTKAHTILRYNSGILSLQAPEFSRYILFLKCVNTEFNDEPALYELPEVNPIRDAMNYGSCDQLLQILERLRSAKQAFSSLAQVLGLYRVPYRFDHKVKLGLCEGLRLSQKVQPADWYLIIEAISEVGFSKNVPVNLGQNVFRQLVRVICCNSIGRKFFNLDGDNFEQLGGMESQDGHLYSIRINNRWRICFRFNAKERKTFDIEVVDYH